MQQAGTHACNAGSPSANYHEAGHPCVAIILADLSKPEFADVFAFLHGLRSLWAGVACDAPTGEEDLPCLGIPLEVNDAVVLDDKLTCRFAVAADELIVVVSFHDFKFLRLIID